MEDPEDRREIPGQNLESFLEVRPPDETEVTNQVRGERDEVVSPGEESLTLPWAGLKGEMSLLKPDRLKLRHSERPAKLRPEGLHFGFPKDFV